MKKSNKVNIVYSTNPDYEYEYNDKEEENTLEAHKQNLRISIDKKQRKGKTVTLIDNFIGTEDDLKKLGKLLKSKCGVGGSVKDRCILIQGDLREKVKNILISEGYIRTK